MGRGDGEHTLSWVWAVAIALALALQPLCAQPFSTQTQIEPAPSDERVGDHSAGDESTGEESTGDEAGEADEQDAPEGGVEAAEDLQERLTEREDKRRPLDPIEIEISGRPLIVGGEVELESETLWPYASGLGRRDRSQWDLGLEAEAFYTFGKPLSLFAQVRMAVAELQPQDEEPGDSSRYIERGEMWLYSEDIGGSGISLDLGRLDFEDDRRWWWDDELDAIRIAFETDRFDIALAYAQELGPDRSDREYIDADHDHVRRLIAETSWDWASNHALQAFALQQRDRSSRQALGQIVRSEREDEFDADLTWLGARSIGVFELDGGGLLGYWLDWAQVRGDERLTEFEALDAQHGEVVEIKQHKVRGHAVDVGVNWLLPYGGEPRLFAGYASASGDDDDDDAVDHAFQQTLLQANEAGFGGVQRYPHYGVLLDPELSNLRVATLGAGLSLLRSSSLDLVYHRYRLAEPAEQLRDARLELELDETHRDLGSAIDLVLALEEWERFEFDLALSAFRAGRAVVDSDGEWSYGLFFAVRLAF